MCQAIDLAGDAPGLGPLSDDEEPSVVAGLHLVERTGEQIDRLVGIRPSSPASTRPAPAWRATPRAAARWRALTSPRSGHMAGRQRAAGPPRACQPPTRAAWPSSGTCDPRGKLSALQASSRTGSDNCEPPHREVRRIATDSATSTNHRLRLLRDCGATWHNRATARIRGRHPRLAA